MGTAHHCLCRARSSWKKWKRSPLGIVPPLQRPGQAMSFSERREHCLARGPQVAGGCQGWTARAHQLAGNGAHAATSGQLGPLPESAPWASSREEVLCHPVGLPLHLVVVRQAFAVQKDVDEELAPGLEPPGTVRERGMHGGNQIEGWKPSLEGPAFLSLASLKHVSKVVLTCGGRTCLATCSRQVEHGWHNHTLSDASPSYAPKQQFVVLEVFKALHADDAVKLAVPAGVKLCQVSRYDLQVLEPTLPAAQGGQQTSPGGRERGRKSHCRSSTMPACPCPQPPPKQPAHRWSTSLTWPAHR